MMIPQIFISAAQEAMRQTGVFASVSLAQWALESGWGKHQSGAHNWFGVKARTGEAGRELPTTEIVGGKSVRTLARFASYVDDRQSFFVHGGLFFRKRKGRYVYYPALGFLPQSFVPEGIDFLQECATCFAKAIAPIYATDPGYAGKILRIMTTSQLEKYDVIEPVHPLEV